MTEQIQKEKPDSWEILGVHAAMGLSEPSTVFDVLLMLKDRIDRLESRLDDMKGKAQ